MKQKRTTWICIIKKNTIDWQCACQKIWL